MLVSVACTTHLLPRPRLCPVAPAESERVYSCVHMWGTVLTVPDAWEGSALQSEHSMTMVRACLHRRVPPPPIHYTCGEGGNSVFVTAMSPAQCLAHSRCSISICFYASVHVYTHMCLCSHDRVCTCTRVNMGGWGCCVLSVQPHEQGCARLCVNVPEEGA